MTVVKLVGIECNEFTDEKTGNIVRYAKLYGEVDMPDHSFCIGQKIRVIPASYKYISECFDDLQLYIGERVRVLSDNGRAEEIRLYN